MALRIFPPVTAIRPTSGLVLREPFNRGLVCAIAPGLGAGLTDLVHGLVLNKTQDCGSVGGGTSGLSGAAEILLPDSLKLTLPITVIARISATAVMPVNTPIFTVGYSNPAVSPFVSYGLGTDASGKIRAEANSGATFIEWNGGIYARGGAALIGSPLTVLALFTSDGHGIYYGPDDGNFLFNSRSNPTYSATARLMMGYAGANVCVEYGLIYNRRLSPDEMALFRANPYHWVQPSTATQFALGPAAAVAVPERVESFLWMPV